MVVDDIEGGRPQNICSPQKKKKKKWKMRFWHWFGFSIEKTVSPVLVHIMLLIDDVNNLKRIWKYRFYMSSSILHAFSLALYLAYHSWALDWYLPFFGIWKISQNWKTRNPKNSKKLKEKQLNLTLELNMITLRRNLLKIQKHCVCRHTTV